MRTFFTLLIASSPILLSQPDARQIAERTVAGLRGNDTELTATLTTWPDAFTVSKGGEAGAGVGRRVIVAPRRRRGVSCCPNLAGNALVRMFYPNPRDRLWIVNDFNMATHVPWQR